jgi:hypothetical protein
LNYGDREICVVAAGSGMVFVILGGGGLFFMCFDEQVFGEFRHLVS